MGKETRTQIRQLISFSPTITDAEISRVLGITRQAVNLHTRSMGDLVRDRGFNKCTGCGIRISKRRTLWCNQCRKMSYSYEFVCFQCGTLNVATGASATQRRRLISKNPKRKEFCNNACASRYRAKQRWALEKLRNA